MTEFVLMSGDAEEDCVGKSRDDRARDPLTAPAERARLRAILQSVERTEDLKQEVASLLDELRSLGRFGSLVGRSEPMQRVYDLVARVAPTESTVFVSGESGTGKELVAQTVYALSKRRDGPFLAINCGAISPALIESELFGHEKGSFTGATRRRRGYFEEASGGTLFLDEVTEMPIDLQVKLLRVLETGTITRVGATGPTSVDVRVITASNRDPKWAVERGLLREDLLYRLNVFPIELPPLRDRGDDVLLLAELFLDGVNRRESSSKRLSRSAARHLLELRWPGNVRQLKNVIERAAILAERVISPAELPAHEVEDDPDTAAAASEASSKDSSGTLQVRVGASISEVERCLILATIDQFEGDKKRAAKALGISLKTLYTRLKVYEAESKARH